MDPKQHMAIDGQRRADLVRRAEEHALAARLEAKRGSSARPSLAWRLRRWRRGAEAPEAAPVPDV